MSEYTETLSTYSPTDYSGNIDLGFNDPILNADLTDPESYEEVFKSNINVPTIEDFKKVAEKIKTTKFPVIKDTVNPDDSIILPELLKQEGVDFKVTSDYRPGAVTKSGHASNHSKQNGAYDIIPINGKSFEDLRQQIYGNKRIRDWMIRHNWGIIEETTPEVMKKTGATGRHWHFGPDTEGVQNWNNNLVKYGQNGFKFEENLSKANSDVPSFNIDKMLLFKNALMDSTLDNYDQFIYDSPEEYRTKFPTILPKEDANKVWNGITYSGKNFTGQVPNLIRSMIGDSTKANILTQIAYNESSFNPNAKNPRSSASGLFGFIDSTKNKYGYGDTPQEQIAGASRLYDQMEQQAASYIYQFGTRGLNKAQIMYGMWFSPRETLNYIKTGRFSNFKDAQGTSLRNIFQKMS